MVLLFDLVDIYRRCRKVHTQRIQSLGDNLGDSEVTEPFVVRGNDKPGSVFAAAFAQHVFESFGVGIPERALSVVPIADLPVTGGVGDACFKTLQLLKLENMGVVVM